MSDFPYRSALIVGAGAGISASLARLLSTLGVKVGAGPDAHGAFTDRREHGVHGAFERPRALLAHGPGAESADPKTIS